MADPKYTLRVSNEEDVYEFDSVGPNGIIPKIIRFSPMLIPNTYNLAFGDKVEAYDQNGNSFFEIDDETESRNGDIEQIIRTVVASIYVYTEKYPERQIFFQGSDDRRTRIYRLAMTRHYIALSADFAIFGIIEEAGNYQIVPVDSKSDFTGFFAYRLNAQDMKQNVVKEANTRYNFGDVKIIVDKRLDDYKFLPSKKEQRANEIVSKLKLPERKS